MNLNCHNVLQAPDFQGIMELLSSLMGGCIIVLRGRSKILFENATALTLLNRF